MLSAAHRLTDAESFRLATRHGRRVSSRTLVTQLVLDEVGSVGPPRVGFVVSKAVGNAVVRNRVQRRLRHLVRGRLLGLPDAAVLVVRALPSAATAGYDQLGHDLDRCLTRYGAAA